MVVLRKPLGACIGECWYDYRVGDSCGRNACPSLVVISTLTCFTTKFAANFNGRGKTGHSCAGTDTYVSTNTTSLFIDVWKAYADGVWTSSVVIEVYASQPSSCGAAVALSIDIVPFSTSRNAACASLSLNGSSSATVLDQACPTFNVATLTVFDNGTMSAVYH